GRNVKFEYRFTNGENERFPAAIADLLRNRVSVILAGSIPVTRALQAATSTIPILFSTGLDAVRTGLVPNLNRPGGNTTGVLIMSSDVAQKRIGILHELLPRSAMIAILANPTNDGSLAEAIDAQQGARALGKQARVLHASTDRELDAAFANLAQQPADALHI